MQVRKPCSGWGRSRNTISTAFVEIVLRERPHPEQGFRTCIGILQLAKEYSRERLEAACSRALTARTLSYRSVKSILVKKLDRHDPAPTAEQPAIIHDNIRGQKYYN